ncbi:hypothetical protein H1V43_10295 [Streptomyces sp. PSKA54]|uniref:Secreted protein n=1 Tax=Streptomyces himalayensis subsp. aureolus TaxID=2758039 RepID=A0A7W2CZ70_9ACTN|nr:hypothetical protein [Streptomyces himalayensis]MBA4861768.1 hypothetical protein [Streptomyces himalayensis subsp. aureolus]
MAASANLLLSALSKPMDLSEVIPAPANGPDECMCFTAEGACAEAPLTSEPPLAAAAPLTSEPPLADVAPLTSEPTPTGAAASQDPMGA